jgi:glycosyltransferase involved in cell wall biosynthesis
MAVRDGELYLLDAIESVLSQSVTDFEFLIVDDGSSDGTPGILSEPAPWGRIRARTVP